MGTPMSIVNSNTINNTNYGKSRTLEADVVPRISKTLAAAKAMTLSVRTNNTDGTLNGAGHGIATGNRLDIYWDVGGVKGSRRGVVAGTVAGNDVPISGGAGDVLPVVTSPMIVMVVTSEDLVVTGNNVQFYAFKAPNNVRAIVVFADAANAELHAEVISAGQSAVWDTGSGITNPLAGDAVAKIFLSHADSAAAQTVVGDVGYN